MVKMRVYIAPPLTSQARVKDSVVRSDSCLCVVRYDSAVDDDIRKYIQCVYVGGTDVQMKTVSGVLTSIYSTRSCNPRRRGKYSDISEFTIGYNSSLSNIEVGMQDRLWVRKRSLPPLSDVRLGPFHSRSAHAVANEWMTRGLKRKGGGHLSLGETVVRVASFPALRTLINSDVGSHMTPHLCFLS